MSEVSAGMSEEIVQSSEHKDPKFLRYQEQALNFFQTNNYFAIEDGQILFDIAKFKSKAPHESLRAAIGPLATRPEYGGGQWPLTLLHVFKDVKGYSSEDFDRIKRGESRW